MKRIGVLLIVEKNQPDRSKLTSLFSDKYTVIVSQTKDNAIDFFKEHAAELSAVLLGSSLSSDDVRSLLAVMKQATVFMPVFVLADKDISASMEEELLACGAFDVIRPPYDSPIFLHKADNAAALSDCRRRLLSETHKRMNDVLDLLCTNPNIVVIITLRDGCPVVERANERCALLFGLYPESMAGKTPYDLFDANTAQNVSSRIMECMSSNKTVSCQAAIPILGKTNYFDILLTPLVVDDDRVAVFGLMRDIGEEVLARRENELLALEYSAMFDNTNDHITVLEYTSDKRYTVRRYNHAAILATRGYPKEEVIDKDIHEVFGSDAIQVERNLAACLAAGKEYTVPEVFINDGVVCHYETTYLPIPGEDGKLLIFCIAKDVTLVSSQQEYIRQLAREYNAMFEASSEPMSVIEQLPDKTFVARRLSRSSIALQNGQKSEDLIGKSIFDVYGNTAKHIEKNLNKCLALGREYSFSEHLKLQGKSLYLETSYIPLVMGEGQNPLILCIAKDVTELEEQRNYTRQLVAEYEALFASSNNVMLIIRLGENGEFYIERVNDVAETLFGVRSSDILGLRLDTQKVLDFSEFFGYAKKAIETGKAVSFDSSMTIRGNLFYSTVFITPLISGDRVTKLIVASIDRTQKALMMDRLATFAMEYDCIFSIDDYGIWIIETHPDGYRFERGNETFAKTFDYSIDKITGKFMDEFCSPANKPLLKGLYDKAVQTRRTVKKRHKIHKGEKVLHVELTVTPVIQRDEVIKLICILVDQTDTFEYMKRIEYMSYHDSITGLYNRRYLEQYIERLEKESDLDGSFVVVFDVNGLKTVNDTFGHDAGDNLIINFANIISKQFPECVVGASGGDEFTVIGKNISEDELLHRLKEFDKMHCFGIDNEVPTSISAGYKYYHPSHKSISETIRLAEENMYEKKFDATGASRTGYIEMLREFMYDRNIESKEHIERMVALADEFSGYLGLDTELKNTLIAATILHDIGKIGIPKDILTKPGALTGEEFEKIKKHSQIGYRIALSSRISEKVAKAIKHHHEHYDGSGYPDGLSGDNIPFCARVLSIIDSYDVISSGTFYHGPNDLEKTLAEIGLYTGHQYDPELTQKFITMLHDASTSKKLAHEVLDKYIGSVFDPSLTSTFIEMLDRQGDQLQI